METIFIFALATMVNLVVGYCLGYTAGVSQGRKDQWEEEHLQDNNVK